MIELRSYVGGQWKKGEGSSASVTLLNPATEAPLAVTSRGGVDFGEALTFAREHGGPALRTMTFRERGDSLGR